MQKKPAKGPNEDTDAARPLADGRERQKKKGKVQKVTTKDPSTKEEEETRRKHEENGASETSDSWVLRFDF